MEGHSLNVSDSSSLATGSSDASVKLSSLASDIGRSSFKPTAKSTEADSIVVTPMAELSTAKPSDTSVAAPPAEASVRTRLDLSANPSIEDMSKAGIFQDKTGQTETIERASLKPGESPEIKVLMTDANLTGEKQPAADFLIKKDGSIELLNNPEKTGQKEIVIAVEREAGQLKPSETQQEVLNQLFTYLDGRIKSQFPDAQESGVKVDDKQNLLPQQLEDSLKTRSAQPESQMPPETQRQVQDMNRFRGSGEGNMSRRDADDYFPQRSVPRQANETDRIAAAKDVVAGFTSRGAERPYEHVVHRGERGFGVGRYGLTYDMIANWLDGVDIGNLEELERQGKVPKGTAARMKAMKASMAKAKETGNSNDLDPFLQKLKAGDKDNPVTASDINENFGKEVQELAATHNIGRFSQELGGTTGKVDPGELALSMMLGRTPTQEDLANGENKQFVDAARQSYQIALNRYTTSGDTIGFNDAGNMTEAMRDSVGKALWTDYANATENGNLACAIAVTRILRAGGVPVSEQLSVDGTASEMRRIGAQKTSLSDAISSGKPYVIIKQTGGSHTGIGIGTTVVENSSSKARVVQRNINDSSLATGSYAYIIPDQYTKNA